jgi:hypothetical protein
MEAVDGQGGGRRSRGALGSYLAAPARCLNLSASHNSGSTEFRMFSKPTP